MGQEGPASTGKNQIDEVDEANLSGERPDGESVVLAATEDGRLIISMQSQGGDSLTDALQDVATDELRTRIFGVDDGGNLVEANLDTLDATLAGTENALITQLANALEDVGADELRSRIFDTTGTAIDPATDALEDALKSNDTDEMVVRLTGADGTEIAEEALDTGVAGTDVGVLTYLSRALNSQDLDEFITRVTDSSGTQIDPLTQDPLQSVGSDQLRVDLQNNNAGTLPVEQQSPVGIEDDTGTQVAPLNQNDATPLTGTATASGSANAISFDLGTLRASVDFFYDLAADGELHVEVSTDGSTWRSFLTVNTADANVPQSDVIQYETAYKHTRAYADGALADADVNQLEASAKGVK